MKQEFSPNSLAKRPRALLSWKPLLPNELIEFNGFVGRVVSCKLLHMSYHVPKNVLTIRCGSEYLSKGPNLLLFYEALGYSTQRDLMAMWFQKPKFVFSNAEIEVHILEFEEPLLDFR